MLSAAFPPLAWHAARRTKTPRTSPFMAMRSALIFAPLLPRRPQSACGPHEPRAAEYTKVGGGGGAAVGADRQRGILFSTALFRLVDKIPPAEYSRGMKVKTSISLSEELLKDIDRYGKAFRNRSDFIEAAISAFIGQIVRDRQNARDIEIINRNAERLNAEAQDVLAYQVQP